jgi:hypothetical protein
VVRREESHHRQFPYQVFSICIFPFITQILHLSNVDLYDCLAADVRDKHKFTTYDLISNIVHDGKPQTEAKKSDMVVDIGHYRVQLVHEVLLSF